MNSQNGHFDLHCKKARQLCREYLQGQWKIIDQEDIIVKKLSGGLTNHIYYCSLPPDLTPCHDEPCDVLLRLFGKTFKAKPAGGYHNISTADLNNLFLENAIFTLLSERKLGPKLYGVFGEGRLEEYIPSRSMSNKDMRDPKLSKIVARKLAKIHSMSVPVNKEGHWLRKEFNEYKAEIKKLQLKNVTSKAKELAEKLLSFNFGEEIDWLLKILARFQSPIVFCHNDTHGGNILVRNSDEAANGNGIAAASDRCQSDDDKVVFIDFECAGYNHRAFDLANHFCEWMFDYTHKEYPYYKYSKQNFPSKERQLDFFHFYLNMMELSSPCPSSSGEDRASGQRRTRSTSASGPAAPMPVPPTPDGPPHRTHQRSQQMQLERLYHEVQVFRLATNLLWCMWSIKQSEEPIPFGYWEYAKDRFDAYIELKNTLVSQLDSMIEVGTKRMHED